MIPEGLARISDYKKLLKTEFFLDLEKYSDHFIAENKGLLESYSTRWVGDSLHQWSRQWEYPFVFSAIKNYVADRDLTSLKILDAGSGITFLPYYITQQIPGAEITCCDNDPSLNSAFKANNDRTGSDIKFIKKDIKETGLSSNNFDIIYCISVLEHTRSYEKIIDGFHKLLKPNGILIITFDISIDGRSDIPISGAKRLLSVLDKYFRVNDKERMDDLISKNLFFDPEIVTTSFILRWNKSLLPWKYPLVSALLSSIKKRRLPISRVKKLTYTCHIFEKKAC